MIQLKYFKFSQESEINEFLSKNILYGKSNVLVSTGTGEILIPYEDGEPLSPEQLKKKICEDINKEKDNLNVVFHAQMTLEIDLNKIQEQIDNHTKALSKETTKEVRENNKKHQSDIDRLKGVFKEKYNQYIMNQTEITRIMTNITVYEQSMNNPDEVVNETKADEPVSIAE
jgi:hypothetical protein